ncbi:hypothetical protein JYP51_03495 [Ponticoccus gilvus]|nr:hypothetical protein [Enemella evansiae]
MTTYQQKYQPGPVFHDAFLAGLKARTISATDFAARNGLSHQILRQYSCGSIDGAKSREMREKMILEVGPDLFAVLYQARLEVGVAS